MKLIAPDYYSDFSCIADKCTHSCCIGWEIDIDSDTYEYYKQVPNNFGLMAGICADGDTPHFKLTPNERCPFLNEENLCEIIINLGEGSLCQICDDHPRYRNFYSDRTEIGLGLCCEAAGQLILSRTEKVRLTEIENDGCDDELSAEDEVFFNFRQNVFDILQNRELPFEIRIKELLSKYQVDFSEKPYSEWANIFSNLELLDSEWDIRLEQLKSFSDTTLSNEYDTAFEQLTVYFIYRHLADGLYDGLLSERISFAVLGFYIIRALCCVHMQNCGTLTINDIAEIARQYSSEIEYCEDNISSLLDILGNTY